MSDENSVFEPQVYAALADIPDGVSAADAFIILHKKGHLTFPSVAAIRIRYNLGLHEARQAARV